LPHLSFALNLLDLHEDHEVDPFDGEMTFWWMGVDRAPVDEWHRLVNWEIPTYDDAGWACFGHTNYLDDVDDDHYCGNGEVEFSGPSWDFYLREDQGFTVHTTGFEQDCYDDHFGSGEFDILDYADCHFGNFFTEFTNDWGNNDPLEPMNAAVGGPGIDPLSLPAHQVLGVDGHFDFHFALSEIPATDEDDADLAVTKSCASTGEVALAGEPFTCTIVVSNAGPGLPRNVVITDALTTSLAASDYSVGSASFRVGTETRTDPCAASTATGFSCEIGTVPVGGVVTIEVEITPSKPGTFTNTATAATDSSDVDGSNDSASTDIDVFLPVHVDIQPGSAINPVNLQKRGVIPVAILSDADFDAQSVTVATACFGDAENPAQRTCAIAHGPQLADVDRDRDRDLIFQFAVQATGIDPGDSTACLIGTFADGTGFYGCDIIRTQ
jgi:uncharacterized repeat protein (TIGR01451 family)